MKKLLTLLLFANLLVSCSDDDDINSSNPVEGTWSREAENDASTKQTYVFSSDFKLTSYYETKSNDGKLSRDTIYSNVPYVIKVYKKEEYCSEIKSGIYGYIKYKDESPRYFIREKNIIKLQGPFLSIPEYLPPADFSCVIPTTVYNKQ